MNGLNYYEMLQNIINQRLGNMGSPGGLSSIPMKGNPIMSVSPVAGAMPDKNAIIKEQIKIRLGKNKAADEATKNANLDANPDIQMLKQHFMKSMSGSY